MAARLIQNEEGKWVVIKAPRATRGATLDADGNIKERFIAVAAHQQYEVCETGTEAELWLTLQGGGRIYRLTYHMHKPDEELPISTMLKVVEGG